MVITLFNLITMDAVIQVACLAYFVKPMQKCIMYEEAHS